MITEENLVQVISQISESDKRRILRSMKEYCVLYLNIFNAGSNTEIRLTDDYDKYKNVSNDGNAILNTEEVIEVLNSLIDLKDVFDSVFDC